MVDVDGLGSGGEVAGAEEGEEDGEEVRVTVNEGGGVARGGGGEDELGAGEGEGLGCGLEELPADIDGDDRRLNHILLH